MAHNEYNWKTGETAYLAWNEKQLKKSGSTIYASIANSKYICIRQATNTQRGILVKGRGKVPSHQIMKLGGVPFCKDDRSDLINGRKYVSYPFPRLEELKEVLEIVRGDSSIAKAFEEESMHFNPSSTFWVNETASRILLPNKLQYYDAGSDQLCKAADDALHYRLSIAYFYKDNLVW